MEQVFDFGGTLIGFESPSTEFHAALEARFSLFRASRGSGPGFVLEHIPSEDDFRLEHGCLSDIRWEAGRAVFASLPRRGTEVVDGLLRTILPVLAVPDIVVHGALLQTGDSSVLCSGKPGAGKSTIAGLFPRAALCDELCRLRIGSREIEARSLPFWKARPARLPLRSIFLLEHGLHTRQRRLDLSRAIREMQKHVYWPADDEQAAREIFQSLTLLCRRVPVAVLAFRPEAAVWEILDS